jgi:hypothetical protein
VGSGAVGEPDLGAARTVEVGADQVLGLPWWLGHRLNGGVAAVGHHRAGQISVVEADTELRDLGVPANVAAWQRPAASLNRTQIRSPEPFRCHCEAARPRLPTLQRTPPQGNRAAVRHRDPALEAVR